MDVQELIKLLEQVEDKTREVQMEGCDCFTKPISIDETTFPFVLVTSNA